MDKKDRDKLLSSHITVWVVYVLRRFSDADSPMNAKDVACIQQHLIATPLSPDMLREDVRKELKNAIDKMDRFV